MSVNSLIHQNVARLLATSSPWPQAIELSTQMGVFSAPSVLSATTSEPARPNMGDAYIVPTGGWGTIPNEFANQLAIFDGEDFLFFTPRTMTTIWVADAQVFYTWDGTKWVPQTPSALSPHTTNYVVGPADTIVEMDATSGALTVTFPVTLRKAVTIVKVDATTNSVSITPDGATVQGTLSYPAIGKNMNSATVYGNGTSLRII
jgi:hypothetical protein